MNRRDLQALADRELEKQQKYRCRLLCCGSTPCLSSGGTAVQEKLKEILKQNKELKADLAVVSTGCMGPCSRGPLVTVQVQGQDDVIYENVTPEIAEEIVKKHATGEETSPTLDEKILPNDIPFFTKQTKVVLANSGLIDPERLEDYVAHGGYSALGHVLREMTPEEVCQEIINSGLRGRGGAGYPAGLKWNLVRKAQADKKYVVANGDEGDPGAYMDRTLMESDPHRVLEGMAIAGYAVGAEQGFIYVRGEYPIAAKRLEKAIRMAERRGLLGGRVMESNFSFRIDIRIGAGAFVCGEETALMASIMGKRGQPVPRPPYPAQSGLWNSPTLLNNVETFGSIAPIINHGADWYASIGTEKSKGTKIFALAGQVENTGLIEVPMGIPLREIVFDIGGGIPNGRSFKAAQTGGPSGGCIPAEHLDTPVDYESLRALGSIMGSGGLVVMDDTTSMPDVAKFFMEFCMDESCGKCVPCRVGTVQLHRILERITAGTASRADLEILEELCVMMKETSLCGLGQSAPNPLLSTLKFFRDEYEALIQDKPAHINGNGRFKLPTPPAQSTQEVQ
ncbi:MAG: NADH-quinone oxidoreductase subunit L [Chloroflexi bacterium]|nr:MAG: NADH-quinone oxidoreductase subunit L [Chloroflexota bacterium]